MRSRQALRKLGYQDPFPTVSRTIVGFHRLSQRIQVEILRLSNSKYSLSEVSELYKKLRNAHDARGTLADLLKMAGCVNEESKYLTLESCTSISA